MFTELGPDVAELTTMAKKKSKRIVPQNTLVAYKGTESFKAWLKELADFSSLPITNTLDLALKYYAERIGFTKPMPKRQVKRD